MEGTEIEVPSAHRQSGNTWFLGRSRFIPFHYFFVFHSTELVVDLKTLHRSIPLCFSLLLILGCSGGGSPSPTTSQPPSIASQPANQYVFVGQTAAFTVTANGTFPLSYQWRWNGVVIAGATEASFITPPAVPSDNQSTLTVMVSNSIGTVTSTPVSISVAGGPRPPKIGDLRFKDVDAFPVPLQVSQIFNILGGMTITLPDQIGTPLELSNGGPPTVPLNMSWSFAVFDIPKGVAGRTTIYESDTLDNFQTALIARSDSRNIITSMDLVAGPAAFCWELFQTTQSEGYSFGTQTLSITDLQAAATQEGVSSRVITAISWNAGKATYISYGWQGDTTTKYETSVINTSVDAVGTAAITLAQQGYILTAMGGNTSDGFILVGTRVKGDTTPRALVVWNPNGSTTNGRGYSYVGHIFIASPTNSIPGTQLWFLEQ